jgi:phosphoribosylamine--glycine ligase
MKINILIIGSGGREHSLAVGIYKSETCNKLFAAPGNPGIFKVAQKVNVDTNNFDDLFSACLENQIELVVIGPEQPLAEGMTDYLGQKGISVFGPDRFATMLESSKSFAKELMKEYNIPTADFKKFRKDEIEDAKDYIKQSDKIVLKADGLAGGKGVIIPENKETAILSLEEIFNGKFGVAGDNIVIEEFMDGEEASIFAICDGESFITLASSQDHKRALDDDKGDNTGGMGAYSPAPIVTEKVKLQAENEIIKPVLKAMKDKGHPYKGCLYCGLMIKNDLAKVVEFNVRFGDPETQAVLSIFKGDLAKLFYSAAKGKLDLSAIENVENGAACNVVLASEGYPGKYEKGFEITGLEKAEEFAEIYHAGTKEENSKIFSNGGRVLGINGKGDNLKSAIENAYKGVSKVCFNNIYFRKDIGKKLLEFNKK